MTVSMLEHYRREKIRFLEKCKECGVCAKKCPIVNTTALKDLSSKAIQKNVKRFVETGEPEESVYTRAFSCMECFKCVRGCCPEGLNSLTVGEIVRWEYKRKGLFEAPYADPAEPDAFQRVLASIQVDSSDYEKIFSESYSGKAEYVFFPGCNVYSQPEKLLNALDILDKINPNYAFVPGLDNCCGDVHYFAGNIEKGARTTDALIEKLESYSPRKVVFWCPTCHCRFGTTVSEASQLPFEILSFAQFAAQHADSLPLRALPRKTATLHEACKSAYTELDLTGPRDVLDAIPGIELTEMERHGKKTVCCGSGAICFFPESFRVKLEDRLQEASETKTDLLVDICHYCHQVFAGAEKKFGLTSVNYVSLLAEALGIVREDKFKMFAQLANADKILEKAKSNMETSPFSQDQIEKTVRAVFVDFKL